MKLEKIFSWLAAVICPLLLTAGCTKEVGRPKVGLERQIPKAAAAGPVVLALKFRPQDSTTYRLITKSQRRVEFGGSLSGKSEFEDSRNQNTLELTFTQKIQSTDDKGNAIAKITIKKLKYSSIYKNDSVLDFNSAREKDRSNPLAKLIGQSYTIEIAPAGEVTKVINVKQAQAAVKGKSTAHKTALTLLSRKAIKERHSISILPVTDKNQSRTGDTWNSVKNFSFDMMGSKSYERVYTLKEIKKRGNRKIAVIQMNAIPSSEMTEQLYKEQATGDFSKMFDNAEMYTGRLNLDLTAGKVEKYTEELRSQWFIVDPQAKQEESKEPAFGSVGGTLVLKWVYQN